MDTKRRLKRALSAIDDAMSTLRRARSKVEEGRSDISRALNELGRVRISTLRNENETFSQLNSITYIGVFLRLVTYSHLPLFIFYQ